MGILSQLQSDPTGAIIAILYRIPAVLIALTLHELAHGYVALKCGDPTAQMLGRLSFNPMKHLDPVGTLFMFLFGFGWARAVPVNPRNFKNFRRDDFLVSIAGVTVNFCLFLFSMLVMVGIHSFMWSQELWEMGEYFSLINHRDFLSFEGMNFYFTYSGEGLIAMEMAEEGGVYVDDAIHYLSTPWLMYLQRFFMNFSMVNLGLCIFNLLPIPPLDGYHVVNDIFLRGKLHIPSRYMNVIMVGLLVICFATNFFSNLVNTVIDFVQNGVLDAILWIFGMG
ncbi:MAG: site-2 protease family protein [Clostridiales bacterium]|nr:site-2 protease family protein [Clostridiales bacterium]